MKKSFKIGTYKMRAEKNWKDWEDVFEAKGPIKRNPLLRCEEKFKKFRSEYSVNRTIRKGMHEKLRKELLNSKDFKKALNDPSGNLLDRYERKIRKSFGSHNGQRGIISALSKIAAFLRPDTFIAWDQFGKKGLRKALENPNDYKYSDYLRDVHEFLRATDAGRIIKKTFKKGNPKQLRLVDQYLMKLGGRKFT